MYIGHTPHENELATLLAPTVEDAGLELVRCRLVKRGGTVLELLVERTDTTKGGVTLDQCVDVSRRVSRIMDVEDPLADAYKLEVSSPGLERPLTTLPALKAHMGRHVAVQLHTPVEGSRHFTGTLKQADDTGITLTLLEGDKTDETLEMVNIRDIHLHLTKQDLAAVMKAANDKKES